MVAQIRRGIQDFIGAARPSIADPFLPAKIRDGREDEIRECIGCNICRAANNEGVGLRCTQNPTMGEEWRRGWHPERIPPYPRAETALVIGGGPAGLEAALTLGRRGLDVTLAEAEASFGGRLRHEATLPGLQTWLRVRDWRLHMAAKLPNVRLFPASRMTAADIADFGASHIVLATGAQWRRDGVGVYAPRPGHFPQALTPDDIFAGARVQGPVVVYDDDHYSMAGALAEKLARDGHPMHYVTTAAVASSWTVMTNEQEFLQARLLETGVRIHALKALTAQAADHITLACVYTGRTEALPCGTLVLCTGRLPDTRLRDDLAARGIAAALVGDALQPSSVADASIPPTASPACWANPTPTPPRAASAPPKDPRDAPAPSRPVPERHPATPFGQRPRPYDPIRVLSDDHVEAIHQAALRLLRDQGLRVLNASAIDRFRRAGARIDGSMVHPDPGLIEACLATVPRTFTIAARNRAKDLRFGGNDMVFSSVGGPAYVMDLDSGRRDGTLQDMQDFLRLCQSLNVIQQESGGPLEPMDLPPRPGTWTCTCRNARCWTKAGT